MKVYGCHVLFLACLVMGLHIVRADSGEEDDEDGKGRKCGQKLARIDAGDMSMTITNNSISMRKRKGKSCVVPAGLECGVAKAKKELGRGGEDGEDKKGGAGEQGRPRNGTDMEEGHPGKGNGGQGGGPPEEGAGKKPERPGSTRADGKKVCTSFGRNTELYIASRELLDADMNMISNVTEITHSIETDDTAATPDMDIPGSQSDSGQAVKATYATITVSSEGRQGGTTCKAKLQIYIAAGEGNVTFEGVDSRIKKNEVKWNFEVADPANCFCNSDGSNCAAYIKFRICLKVQNGKKEGFNKKRGKACSNDPNENCGQTIESDDGTRMVVSNVVRLDGGPKKLVPPEGSVSIDENSGCIDIVVKKFNTLFMDPIMSASEQAEDLTGLFDTSNVAKLAIHGFSMSLLALLALILTH